MSLFPEESGGNRILESDKSEEDKTLFLELLEKCQ
jgi:hypothetical protein